MEDLVRLLSGVKEESTFCAEDVSIEYQQRSFANTKTSQLFCKREIRRRIGCIQFGFDFLYPRMAKDWLRDFFGLD
jgi:hypothetical protein